MSKEMTGYPSIDKPWLKYYSEEAINAELPECSMYDYIHTCNKENLSGIAINYYGKMISYEEMFRQIESTAKAFAAIGIHEGDTVAICSFTTPEVIYSVYALNRIGAIANMIDPRTNPERMKYYFELSGSKLYLILDRFYSRIQEALPERAEKSTVILSIGTSLPALKKTAYNIKITKSDCSGMSWGDFIKRGTNTEYIPAQYRPDMPAVIVYTGGTTGVPKAAVMSNDTMNAAAFQTVLTCTSPTRGKTILNIMPPFLAYGIVCGIHAAFAWQLMNLIIPWFEPDKLGQLVKKHKPFLMAGVPMHYEKIMDSAEMKKLDLSFFEMPICGGDKLNEQTEFRINQFFASHNSRYRIVKGYGMTEVGSATAMCLQNANKDGSIGVPFCKTVIAVFEPDSENELTYGQEGEICFQTPAMMLGYLGNEQETNKVIRTHKDGRRWVHSGDIGYMDEDGLIYIRGRIKRMIIRPDGHNVWPSLIENVILTHESVRECAVVGRKDSACSSGLWPVAFIVLHEDTQDPDAIIDQIKKLCDEKIPPRDTAADYFVISSLPHTDMGKIDFRALEALAGKENVI